jgi:hypothetical protein
MLITAHLDGVSAKVFETLHHVLARTTMKGRCMVLVTDEPNARHGAVAFCDPVPVPKVPWAC